MKLSTQRRNQNHEHGKSILGTGVTQAPEVGRIGIANHRDCGSSVVGCHLASQRGDAMKGLRYFLKWVGLAIVIWSMIVALIYLLCPCATSVVESHVHTEIEWHPRHLISYNNQVFDLRGQPDSIMEVEP